MIYVLSVIMVYGVVLCRVLIVNDGLLCFVTL